jgi:histone H3
MARTKITATSSRVEHKPLSRACHKPTYSMAARRSAPGTGGMKKRRRAKPGVKALREIKQFQKETYLLIQRAPFQRLCRQILQGDRCNYRMSFAGTVALQEAAEDFLVNFFDETVLAASHAGRKTIQKEDVEFVRRILCRGPMHGH